MRYDGAAKVDLGVGRFADFVQPFEIEDDWTGNVIEAQVRLYPDAPGTPLATFSVSPPIFANGITSFSLALDEMTYPNAPEPGADLILHWDMMRVSGGVRKVVFYGKYVVHAGVVQ